MKIGQRVTALMALVIFSTGVIPALAQAPQMYVNIPTENLRNAPNGKKIGTVLEGTKAAVVQEQGNWVRVQITGWIWKPSLSDIKLSMTGDYRALHILVKTREKAEQINAQLNAGEDFRELARKNSIAPNAPNGGDLGYFDKGDFAEPIEETILNLQVGEVSGVVETTFGYNIFKRLK